MESSQLAWITNYIWGLADDVLRDLYVRGKYRDVILPMTMGTIFEELVRRFNEENNEEAGEHWTPRDAQPLRTLEEIRADILALERETEGLLGEILGGGAG